MIFTNDTCINANRTGGNSGDGMEYFDLDAILCEEQKVKVKFPVPVPWFGYLQEIDRKDVNCL